MKDIDNIRRANIAILEKEAGGATQLAERVKMELAQYLNLRDGAKDSKTGKRRGMRKETAWRFDDVGHRSRGWLDEDHSDTNVIPVELEKRPIPVIDYVQAGKLKEISDPYQLGDGFDVEYCSNLLGQWAFALEIDGKSMLPEFREGDRIIIDPDAPIRPGDYVVAKNSKQEATFKKYRPRGINKDGEIIFELVPLNEDFPTLRSDVEQLFIIGRMVEHRKRYF